MVIVASFKPLLKIPQSLVEKLKLSIFEITNKGANLSNKVQMGTHFFKKSKFCDFLKKSLLEGYQ